MARQFEIHLDADLCIGSGLCLGIAPEHFAAGPDHRTVARTPVAAADDALHDAVACCPVEAISIVER